MSTDETAHQRIILLLVPTNKAVYLARRNRNHRPIDEDAYQRFVILALLIKSSRQMKLRISGSHCDIIVFVIQTD